MKTITIKTLAIGVVATTMLAFTSCTKNHTCTCTTTSTQPGVTAQAATTDVNTYTKVSKTAAELNCQPGTMTDSQTQSGDTAGVAYTYIVTTTRTCTLK